jgi:hypothetical protein
VLSSKGGSPKVDLAGQPVTPYAEVLAAQITTLQQQVAALAADAASEMDEYVRLTADQLCARS